MLYGTVVLFCLITLEQWRSIGSTSSKHKHQAKAYGVDLRSLHFPSEYHATGVLSLPTSNISEPFEVWHSKTHDKSRIDYYHGKIIHMFWFYKLTLKSEFESLKKIKKKQKPLFFREPLVPAEFKDNFKGPSAIYKYLLA